jgi:hypothetical protein
MFHYRSNPDYRAIDHRLRTVESELQRIGRKATDQVSAANEQIGDVLAPIMSEIADRIRTGGRYAGDEAARLGNDAVRLGTRIGNHTLRQIAAEMKHRPLMTLAVAVGVGMLIGIAGRRQ